MEEAAKFFKALADEVRLKMLWLLFNQQELCVCDFIEVLEITQSKASRHLRTLYNAGLVTDRREGLWSYYSLKRTQHKLIKTHLEMLRTTLANRPISTQLLKKLALWLKRKECHGMICK